jgi:hypothetical protein
LHRKTGRRLANIREITGVEEQSVSNNTTIDAMALIRQLLVTTSEQSLSEKDIGQLTTWERDQVLAAIYIRHYGTRIDSTMQCGNCNAPFDMDFSLQALMEDLTPDPDVEIERLEDGGYHIHNVGFRLPTGDDECAVFGLPPDQAEAELLQRCLMDRSSLDTDTLAEVQNAMQALSPVVNVDLDAKCPECGHDQSVQFDLQRYLLTSLMNDRGQLVQEIHLLASAYGWRLSEILNLTRSQRRAFVEMVDAEDALHKVRGLS